MNLIKKITFLVLVLSFYFCNSNPNKIDIIEEEKPEEKRFISASPSIGVYGTKLKLTGAEFYGDYTDWHIDFGSGYDWMHTDSILVDTLFATIPYGAESGELMIYNESLNDTLYVEDIRILENASDTVEIKLSNLNYEITKFMASYNRVEKDEKTIWEVEKKGDTIKIKGCQTIGESFNCNHLYLIDKGKNKLPSFVKGYEIQYTDYGTNQTIKFEKGVIKIDKWDTGNIISGRVMDSDWSNRYIFWYKF